MQLGQPDDLIERLFVSGVDYEDLVKDGKARRRSGGWRRHHHVLSTGVPCVAQSELLYFLSEEKTIDAAFWEPNRKE